MGLHNGFTIGKPCSSIELIFYKMRTNFDGWRSEMLYYVCMTGKYIDVYKR